MAAGVIRTDLEKGFIRAEAEVIAFDDYVAHTGERGSNKAREMRLDRKEYFVKDGNVTHLRFNV